MARWRILLHALDRTGPPRLAQALIDWWNGEYPADELEVIALRGGALRPWFEARTELIVVLADGAPPPQRAERDGVHVAMSGEALPSATLVVSVSSAPLLWLAPAGGPTLVWVVETEEEYEPELADPALFWAAGSAVSRLDARRRLAELRAEPAREVALLPEFVATPRPVTSRTEARRRLGVTDDEFLVMAAGIGTERKAPDLFVEIALGFNARRAGARPARFVWVGGEDGELRRRVADHAASYPPLDLVTFVPTVDDLDSVLAAADVFLHPAREDAFPLVCVTAAALGVPVVAFAGVGGVPEMLGETFVGAPYPDVRSLVDHVLRLADAPTAQAVGRAQQARVVARYLAPTGAPRVRAALERAALERSGLECPGAGTGSQRQGGEAPGERTASSAGG